ncbi:MAG: 2-5 ligase LigT [Pseudomonadota bacterium]|jgi:2'-5' RNA ligase
MKTASWRLFLAMWPDAAARAALAEQALRWGWPDAARRYGESDWHVTLQFLGTVPQGRLVELRAGLAVGFEPFDLRLDRAELWSRGLAVLTCSQVPAGLQRLHDGLAQAMSALGLQPETRHYLPHLTLARSATGALLPSGPPAIRWTVRDYALVRSTGNLRWRYDLLQRYSCDPCPL